MSASPRIETDSVISLLSHVATGQWASIVPRQWLAPLGPLPGIRMTALSEPELSPQISLVLTASEPMPLMSRACCAPHGKCIHSGLPRALPGMMSFSAVSYRTIRAAY
ncbi:hypothetical protein [Arthrobacter sp. JCM 19049]|uniref:hypothetical protein n=1 Tax=Arthrobacter sp. JCM 19049 TaxID=1460643 RepID=UPI000ABB8D0B|nr:hypothetical protein [Arthrobacter sp. JCM 19049]